MKIGVVLSPATAGSVRHVMTSLRAALADRHEIVYLHPSIGHVSDEERHRLAGEFVEACDAIVGIIDPAVLTMRQRMGSQVPYFLLMLGTMARGAFRLRRYLPEITTNDTLIVNSEADRRMCERFFENARVELVPLAYDESAFHPVAPEEHAEIREGLGLPDGARVVLYSGRITPEKNLQAVLRVFGVLVREAPDVHLVLAGRIIATPFPEFGVSAAAFPETLAGIGTKLGIPPERILFAGPVSPAELRELYGISDLTMNLTLHHDENFGLAQVEAMACASPVVGSMWGGLMDTVAHGETGYGVSTVATRLGVKVHWWEAANRALEILREPGVAARFREEGPRRARTEYSQERMRDELARVIREGAAESSARPAEPLAVSAFASEFWEACDPDADRRAPYRRGPRSMELYREMIAPFTGLSSLALAPDQPLGADQTLCLAVPVAGDEAGGFWPDDPLFPLECGVPAKRVKPFEAILAAFRAEPVMTVRRLTRRWLGPHPGALQTLDWMVENGLILRTRDPAGWLPHERVPREVGVPLFSFRRLPAAGHDFIVSD